MKYKIRSIVYGIKNLWKWRKTIYKDRDWDYWYIFEILKVKLQFQSKHFRMYGYHESSEREAQRMELCIRLIDMVQNEYYLDNALMNDLTDEAMMSAIRKHDKAKRILFKLLEYNIERWWN